MTSGFAACSNRLPRPGVRAIAVLTELLATELSWISDTRAEGTVAQITITVKELVDNGEPVTLSTADSEEITVTDQTRVELSAALDGSPLAEVDWLRGEAMVPTGGGATIEGGKYTFTVTGDNTGQYTAKGKGTNSELSQTVTLVIPDAESEDPSQTTATGGVVVELSPGEYDGKFAWVGIGLTVLAIAVVVYVAQDLMADNLLPSAIQEVGSGEQAAGTYAERSAGRIQLLVASIGSVLLLVGAFLSALETRGRLRRTLTAVADADETRGASSLATAVGDALSKGLAELRTMRGTIAVLAIGGLLLIAAVWASASVATPEAPTATPTPTSTPAETPTSTATPPPGTATPEGTPSPEQGR